MGEISKRGILLVVSGPSGSGKGTILSEILSSPVGCDYYFSVSDATRAPREGEVDGVNYNFLSKEAFLAKLAAGGLLEHTCYCGHYYGTPRAAVEENLAMGKNVILEIEVNGALSVKRAFPEAVMLFILPPSFEVVRERLLRRGTETEEVISRRIGEARFEMSLAVAYDYIVVNDRLDKAVSDVKAIVSAEQSKTAHMCNILNGVLGNA